MSNNATKRICKSEAELLDLFSDTGTDSIPPEIYSDHRDVTPGSVFFAIPGSHIDGTVFCAQALVAGAGHLVVQIEDEDTAISPITNATMPHPVAGRSLPSTSTAPVFYAVNNVRRSLALCCAQRYPAQPQHIAAITGTNGKTSTSHFYSSLATAILGAPASYIGTLGLVICRNMDGQIIATPESTYTSNLTTPDPKTLHQTLSHLTLAHGIRHVAVEASSQGLHQSRLDGLQCQAVAFTNLGHDHLDYHGSYEQYFAAKLKLFTEIPSDCAVLNSDSPQTPTLVEKIQGKPGMLGQKKIIHFGRQAISSVQTDDLQLIAYDPPHSFTFSHRGKDYTWGLPPALSAEFQIYNFLCALALLMHSHPQLRLEDVESVLPHLPTPPGRMEAVGIVAKHPQIYVDYAHTPEALTSAISQLAFLRECNSRSGEDGQMTSGGRGKIIVVFGCGGDRDPSKRRGMALAAAAADIVIVTDDNPRYEDPAAIRAEVLQHCRGDAIEIANRPTAIKQAIRMMHPDDLLLVAGRGHEKFQLRDDRRIPMCDASIIRRVLAEI